LIPNQRREPESPPVIRVLIGEIRCGRQGVLRAVLGSCVGIVIWRKRGEIAGMAHCLLPWAPDGQDSSGARYVDSGIVNLLAELGWEQRKGEEPPREWRAAIAGGNRLFNTSRPADLEIGAMNLNAARTKLRELHIPFVEVSKPGDRGCRMEVDCVTKTVTAEGLATEEEALACK
jgi:chemotaxis protein CheD